MADRTAEKDRAAEESEKTGEESAESDGDKRATSDDELRSEIAGALGVEHDDPQVSSLVGGIKFKEQMQAQAEAATEDAAPAPASTGPAPNPLDKYPGATLEEKLEAQRKDRLEQHLKDKGLTHDDLVNGYTKEKVTDLGFAKVRETEKFIPDGTGPGRGTYVATRTHELPDGTTNRTEIWSRPNQPAEI